MYTSITEFCEQYLSILYDVLTIKQIKTLGLYYYIGLSLYFHIKAKEITLMFQVKFIIFILKTKRLGGFRSERKTSYIFFIEIS